MPRNNFLARMKATLQKWLPAPQQPDPDEPITIATFPGNMRAYAELVQSQLEAEGIRCLVIAERAYGADPVRLRVRRADAAEGRAILAEMEADEIA